MKIMKTFDEQFNTILIDKFLVEGKNIKDNAMFLTEFQFDIKELIHFIKEVEFHFQVNISRQDIKQFLTVGEAKICIKQKLKIYPNMAME